MLQRPLPQLNCCELGHLSLSNSGLLFSAHVPNHSCKNEGHLLTPNMPFTLSSYLVTFIQPVKIENQKNVTFSDNRSRKHFSTRESEKVCQDLQNQKDIFLVVCPKCASFHFIICSVTYPTDHKCYHLFKKKNTSISYKPK